MDDHDMNPHQSQDAYWSEDEDIKSVCRRYMNYHVIGYMRNGEQFEGIIIDVDDEGVSMLVAEWVEEQEYDTEGRQFGSGRRRFRRFRRRRFPFFFFVFPFFRLFPFFF